jgi:hypothetical protein
MSCYARPSAPLRANSPLSAPPRNHIPPPRKRAKAFSTGHGREHTLFLKHFSTSRFCKTLILKMLQRFTGKFLEEKKVKKDAKKDSKTFVFERFLLSLSIERNKNS